VRSAYQSPAREPAKNLSAPTFAAKVIKSATKPVDDTGAASELKARLDGICDGTIYNVPFSFQVMTRLTQALLPGSIVNVVGDPGVGKTFLILQELQFWHGNGFLVAVFFIEKNRVFHTMRLLAQLEGDGRLVDLEWVKANRDKALDALANHRQIIDELGKHIHSAPAERVTLDTLLMWIQERCAEGNRVLVVDPITAVAAGDQRWTKDDDFMLAAQAVLGKHGASLILVTHAKKGNRPGSPTMHDMAAGAAYARFADTSIWLQKLKKPRDVYFQTPYGKASGKFSLFFQLHKTRDARGCGLELAFRFGDGLKFSEQGIVLGDAEETVD
jgi:KaiC/GvpD/RAD55 family RecA-like ATPase